MDMHAMGKCCFRGCNALATEKIVFSSGEFDYVDACADHAAHYRSYRDRAAVERKAAAR